MFHTYCSLDPVNKCISGQLEELAGVVKLEFIHRSVIYIYIYIYIYIKVEGI